MQKQGREGKSNLPVICGRVASKPRPHIYYSGYPVFSVMFRNVFDRSFLGVHEQSLVSTFMSDLPLCPFVL